MCGRSSLTKTEKEIEARFNATFYSEELERYNPLPNFNVAPTQMAPVITCEEPDHLRLFRWGLIPFWAKDKSIGSKMINARVETLMEKPVFKSLFISRRCIVPMDGFYEWKTEGKIKTPFRILTSDQDVFSVAGLWDIWHVPDTGEIISSFTLITTQPNRLMEKIELGKLLFFEPAFANEAKRQDLKFTFTCSSCHVPEAGFRPGRMQGIADGGVGFGRKGESRFKYPFYANDSIDAQGARPLVTLNVAYVENTMWNGSFGSDGPNSGTEALWGVFDAATARNHERLGALEGQNIEGLITHRMNFTKDIVTNAGYKQLFDKAFPDLPENERYSRKGASFAISAYLRQNLTNQAPFQMWLKGDENAMTEQQKKGAVLFFGKAGCNGCHFEKNLGSMKFEALGVDDLYEHGGIKTGPSDRRNLGRGGFTGRDEDMFKFRTPQLYNLGDSGPYFHGGSKETLEDVVRYFNTGVKQNQRVPDHQLSTFIRPLGLSEDEIKNLTEFLANGLRDPNLKRYVPERVLSGLCFPNNDPASKIDMRCN